MQDCFIVLSFLQEHVNIMLNIANEHKMWVEYSWSSDGHNYYIDNCIRSAPWTKLEVSCYNNIHTRQVYYCHKLFHVPVNDNT